MARPVIARPPGDERPSCLHLSVDDVLVSVRDLSEGQFVSVWEHPFFGLLRRLRLKYGAMFSLYCLYTDGRWDLDQASDRFVSELAEASSWLRWGFHGYSYDTHYDSGVTGEEALLHYRRTIEAIARLTGGAALDRMPRVHYFAGSREVVRAWRDAPDGIRGLLTADDSRQSVYHLDREQRAGLLAGESPYDDVERLHLMRTDLRLENEPDPAAALDSLLTIPRRQAVLCVFTHEEQLAHEEVRQRLLRVCQWAKDRRVGYGFPADCV